VRWTHAGANVVVRQITRFPEENTVEFAVETDKPTEFGLKIRPPQWLAGPITAKLNGEPVKIGSPHFVDFGKNLEHSPDGNAYFVAHGASDGTNRRYGYNSWITGDEIYLARVTPIIENMNDAKKYEFFAGYGFLGKPHWTHKLADAKPIAAWRDTRAPCLAGGSLRHLTRRRRPHRRSSAQVAVHTADTLMHTGGIGTIGANDAHSMPSTISLPTKP